MKSLFYLLRPEQSNLGMSVQIIGQRIYNGVLSILASFPSTVAVGYDMMVIGHKINQESWLSIRERPTIRSLHTIYNKMVKDSTFRQANFSILDGPDLVLPKCSFPFSPHVKVCMYI